MSDVSQGPGWWIASDGRWYPPHLHPSVRLSEDTAAESHRQWPDPGGDGDRPDRGGTGPATTPPTRARHRTLAFLTGVVAVLVLAVGVVTILGRTESASATVVDAATATLHDGSARLTVSVTGNTDGTTVTGTGSGAIDFTDSALQLQMTVRTGGPEVPVEAVYEGGRVYESVPGLSTILPGKSWVSMDLSALQKADAQDPSAGGLGNNPAVILQMIAQPGNTVVSLGPSTVDGVAVAGYSVSVNPSRVGHELEQADLPAWMQQDVAGLQLHNVVLKVYVDNAGLLRSLVTQVSETAAATGNGTFDETLDFSDYGQPVAVTAPPADQVEGLQQLLQAAGTQGSASS